MADALKAEGVSVTGSAVGEWERAVSEPGRDKVFALERVFGAFPGQLSIRLGYEPTRAEAGDQRDIVDPADATDYNSKIARMPDHVRRAVDAIIDAEERQMGERP